MVGKLAVREATDEHTSATPASVGEEMLADIDEVVEHGVGGFADEVFG